MEVLSVSKPAGIVKKSSQSDVILHNFAEDLAGAHQTEVKFFFSSLFFPNTEKITRQTLRQKSHLPLQEDIRRHNLDIEVLVSKTF